jgi:FdhE protein
MSDFALTSDQIKKSVDILIEKTPAYSEMLDFYGQIFIDQEDSKSRLRIEPIQISDEMLSVKAREGLPLIAVNEFAIDEKESRTLFLTICNLAQKANSQMANAANAVLNAVDASVDLDVMFSGILNGNEALFENLSADLGIEKTVLGFITYNSLAPSVSACAEQLSGYLKEAAPWLKGYCPICGSLPILAIFKHEGARSLICSFCRYEWSVKRVYCPFCETSENKHLHYFYSEKEDDPRIDVCDNCKKYIKTIDTRKVQRLIYPPLEQVSSLHLDYKASEMGYASGVHLYIET